MGKHKRKPPHNSAELYPYLSLFNRHLGQLRDHLSGTSKQHASVSSFIGGVLWTPMEKDAFFHALSVYSRYRTDLIARCIGTKNEVEVLEYLALLEEGSKHHGTGVSHRPGLPFAHEVSDSWISREEHSAAQLQANEEVWVAQIGTNVEHTQRQTLEKVVETPQMRDTPPGSVFFGGDASKEAALSMLDQNAPLPQSITEVGSAPIRTLQQTTSSISNVSSSHSLDGSTASQSDSDPSNEDQLIQLQDLSPRSRRRHYKRIHMRRKRALTKGEEADLAMNKLRPGPGKKLVKTTSESRIPTSGGSQTESEKTADAAISGASDSTGDVDLMGMVQAPEDELNSPLSTKTMGTHVLHEDIRSSLAHHNVTAEEITASGLDIFNHPKFGRLLKHFISGYDESLAGEDASISVETLHLLSEVLKDFLVQVMSRVIIVEEEHQRLRGTTKVWRKNADEAQQRVVDTCAIHFALKTMGITNENPAQYFADLLDEQYDLPPQSQTWYEDMDRLSDSRNILRQHPLHQDLCLPHYHNAPGSQPRQSLGKTDDFIMDVDTDEKELVLELEEERVLDGEDILADRRHERKLWSEVPLLKRVSHKGHR